MKSELGFPKRATFALFYRSVRKVHEFFYQSVAISSKRLTVDVNEIIKKQNTNKMPNFLCY